MSVPRVEPLKRIIIPDLPHRLAFDIAEYQYKSYDRLIKREKVETVYRVQAVEEIRSIEQNALFHGPFLDAMVAWTGDTDTDYWKAMFKHKFLRFWDDEKKKWHTLRTRNLTSGEFNDFIRKCARWMVDNGGGSFLPDFIQV